MPVEPIPAPVIPEPNPPNVVPPGNVPPDEPGGPGLPNLPGGTGDGTGDGGGGGGSGSGSEANPSYTGPGKDYNDGDDAARFLGLGGHPEVWKDSTTGKDYIVYFASNTEPPIPLMFEVGGITAEGATHTLEAFFGEGNDIVYDRTLDTAGILSTGAIRWGTTNNLQASEGDPWLGFKDRMERYAEVSPYVNDQEILGLIGAAYLEGRTLEEWELQTTDWWQEHNETERAWMRKSMNDPAGAAQDIANNRLMVTNLFESIGAEGNDPALIEWMSNRFTSGQWTETMLADQVEAVTSGWGEIDPAMQDWLDSSDVAIASTMTAHEEVRELFNTWLGPAFAPDDATIASWATRMRNTADGKAELTDMLRNQRLAAYPEYQDPNLTYQDVAGPWKNLGMQVWGEKMDETSDTFQKMMHLNDYTEANKLLRREGMSQDKEKVWKDATSQFQTETSTNVRARVS